MKLLYSPASPYSAKVRMAAHHLALPVETEVVRTDEPPAVLTDNNPLGKIPVLIRDDGSAIYDSVAIMQFLNRESGGRLYPEDAESRTEAEVLEALGDGITDALIAIMYERRFHPEEKQHQPWIDRQWEKVTRGIAYLEANLPDLSAGLNGGHFSVAALMGYLALRFPGQWEAITPNLQAWTRDFENLCPDYQALKPQA